MATTETVSAGNRSSSIHPMFYGAWTTETAAGIHTITVPQHVALFVCMIDTSASAPELVMRHVGELGTGETLHAIGGAGAWTSPADATGVTITNNANGTATVAVAAELQNASGTNAWVAFTKN